MSSPNASSVSPSLPFFDLCSLPGASEEHRAFQQAIRRFVEREISPFAHEWDEAGEFPRELYRKAAAIGLQGLGYPEKYGGMPCDQLTRMIATCELSKAGAGGINASLMSHTIMVQPILLGGSEAIRQKVLPKLFSGEAIGALGITEPSGGSDVAQLTTKALACEGGYRLSGGKTFITSGMRADFYVIAARTGGPGAAGVSVFLVERDSPGFTRQPLQKTGWWASDTASLFFDDVFVPEAHLLGEENRGFGIVMSNFNAERLGMATQAMAFAQVCVEEALEWAKARKTFGQTLISHQVVRQKIVRMIDDILPLQSHLMILAQRVDAGESPVGEISLVKNHAARVMRDCADTAIQILGGSGFMRGGRCERIYREVKVMMIGGGAEEILNDLAARKLGIL
jgi:acyl-CoA dehydrogenase